MGAVKRRVIEFLENGGYDLDYDEWTLPDMQDYDSVLYYKIPVWEYQGQTEREYYGIDKNEGKTMP